MISQGLSPLAFHFGYSITLFLENVNYFSLILENLFFLGGFDVFNNNQRAFGSKKRFAKRLFERIKTRR